MNQPIFHIGDEVIVTENGSEIRGAITFAVGSRLRIQTDDGRKLNRGISLVKHACAFAAKRKAMPTFSINERFTLMSQAIEMVANRISRSLIIVGPGGLGKTYEVNRTLDALGLIRNADYFHVKGYSSARGLYETLHAHNGRLTVFDDCDNALFDPVAKELLKGALDSYDVRTISWLTATKGALEIPNSFEFKGQIIFISNCELNDIDGPMRTRSLTINLRMSPLEIIERMEALLPKLEIDATMEQRRMAMEFIKEWASSIKQLNIRTLLSVLRTIKAHPNNWEALAVYTVSQG